MGMSKDTNGKKKSPVSHTRAFNQITPLCHDTEAGYVCPDDFDRKAPDYHQRISALRGEVEAFERRIAAAQGAPPPRNGVIRRIGEVNDPTEENDVIPESKPDDGHDGECITEEIILKGRVFPAQNSSNSFTLGAFAGDELETCTAVNVLVATLRRLPSSGEVKAERMGVDEVEALQKDIVEVDLRSSGITAQGLQTLLPAIATEGLLPSLELLRLDQQLVDTKMVTMLIKGFRAFREDVVVSSCPHP
ncbi:hypothetical protein FOL47_000865 [Perkinsus chesapeaki]|uniref:Uncharacterized protein n=1 Tax=Perkinsus chesapeaki TaxID=330153 RepID=A0A7J6MLA3_PERCH|nr:hypothetical protein FOL47_000865 [Perkinsus chesapeaki]